MKKYFGDKKFYKMVLGVAIPIVIQFGISNFVNLLDNIMVGRLGTEQMTGVSVVNQLMFVFNLALFGAISGPGIFTAQYAGQKNDEGVRHTLRFKLIISFLIAVGGVLVFIFFKENLIMLFLHDNNSGIDLAKTLFHAKEYLFVMLFGLIPFAITWCYAGTLRECGETNVPMVAGIIAIGVNLVFNYILIFGHFGAPKLGVVGAAVATVLSRYVELLIVVIWTHAHKDRASYGVGLYKHFFSIPFPLVKKIITMGLPLALNEFLWSMGMSALTQCYSMRGLDVVAAFNISNTIVNLFNVVLISMGNVVSIIIGQELGAGNLEGVVDTDRKLITIGVLASATMALILVVLAPLFPKFYNTTPDIKDLSVKLMRIAAIFMPMGSYLNCAYFTIRSGGKTFITFLFDSAFLWVICWPVAFVISRYTGINILGLYVIVLSLDIIKVTIGAILLKKRIWINNIVNEI